MTSDEKKPKAADELTMEEFLALSRNQRRIKQAEYYEKLVAELDRVMPEVENIWYRGSRPIYQCRICGGAVFNRVLHLRYHRGSEMADVLHKLFGRP